MRKKGDEDRSEPSAELIKELEGFGYKADAVQRWTATRARLALAKAQKDRAITLKRAIEAAKKEGYVFEDAPTPEDVIPYRLRVEAAEYIEECLDRYDLSRAIDYSLSQMTADELRRLGGYLARLLRDGAEAGGTDGRGRGGVADERPNRPARTDPVEGTRPEGQRGGALTLLSGIED